MKNANKMRVLANKAIASTKATIKNKAINYCKSTIFSAVKHAATCGFHSTTVDIENGVSLEQVYRYLCRKGYKVELYKNNNYYSIEIQW